MNIRNFHNFPLKHIQSMHLMKDLNILKGALFFLIFINDVKELQIRQ